MSEFTYLFRGRSLPDSPEQLQRHLEKWLNWFKELGAQGHVKDPGHPLEQAGVVVKGAKKLVVDGPYAEAKDVVCGYMLIEAKDLKHATTLATGCPILEVGGSVEIREIQAMQR